jgi:hypothetical protein
MTPAGAAAFARNVRPTSDQSAREDDPGFEAAAPTTIPSAVRLASAA